MPQLIRGHLRFTEHDDIINDFNQKYILPIINNKNDDIDDTEKIIINKIRVLFKQNRNLNNCLLQLHELHDNMNQNMCQNNQKETLKLELKKTLILFIQVASLHGHSLTDIMT